MENLIISLNAVVPFFIYISLGYAAVRLGIANEAFMREMNHVIFLVFFPFMMFNNLYKIDFHLDRSMGFVWFAVASLLVLILLLLLTVPLFIKENRRRGVVIQAIFRSNTVLFAIPLTESIFGQEGAAAASMVVAFIVPIYNISAILILELFRGGKPSLKKIGKGLVTNPLLAGAAAGVLFALSPLTLPECLANPVAQLSALATPAALFVLGGTLHLSETGRNLKFLVPVLSLKMIIIPAVMLLLMQPFHFSRLQQFAVFSMYGTPIATSSFPMAASMGGDASLAGQFVVFSTVVSAFTMLVWIFVMKNTGII